MSGLLRRLRRRRPATADETQVPTPASSEPAGAPAETPAEPGGGQPVPASGDQATQVLPPTGDQPSVPAEPAVAAEPVATPQPEATPEPAVAAAEPAPAAAAPVVARDLPAGVDPGQLELGPAASARRGKLRRRLRYLRRVRELLLRDLGGFVYEVHRTAAGIPRESHRRLIAAKAERIATLDLEVRGLESRLGEPHAEPVLREPGIGGTCPECGELHSSDARYCSRCGTPLDAKALAQRDAAIAAAAAAQPTTGSHAVTEPGPASVLWAAGPRPATAAEPEAMRPASVTSQWLARRDQPTVMADAPAAAVAPPAVATPPAAVEPAPAQDEPAAKVTPAATPPAEATPVTAPTADTSPETAPTADAPPDTAPTADAPPETAPTADAPPEVDAAPAAGAPPTAEDAPAPAAEPGAPSEDVAAAAEKPKRAPRTRKPAADDAPAKPRRAPRPRKGATPAAEDAETHTEDGANPNGRRDEDVPPPVPSGDPLSSRGEERP